MDLIWYFQNCIVLATLTQQTAIFGFLDSTVTPRSYLTNCLFAVTWCRNNNMGQPEGKTFVLVDDGEKY